MLTILLGQVGCMSSKKLTDWKVDEWRMVKTDKNDPPSWIIYSRKLDANFLEYKIEGEIDASPQSCIDVFRQDIYDQAQKSKNKKYPVYKIVSESKDTLLTYVVHNEPFPLKDTEMSVKYFFQEGNERQTRVSWKEAWELSNVQPTKKLSRVETFRGSWGFSSHLDNPTCKATNTVQFDPKKVPMWLVQPMVIKFLKSGLKDIEEKVSDGKI